MTDVFDLDRFVTAQRDTFSRALQEVRSGAKRSHWMWYIFPQLRGLGHSPMSQRFAISGLPEAKAYLAHGCLGSMLVEITQAPEDLADPDATRVFGSIDAIKLRSSLTLFRHADGDARGVFGRTIDRWFDGQEDAETASRL